MNFPAGPVVRRRRRVKTLSLSTHPHSIKGGARSGALCVAQGKQGSGRGGTTWARASRSGCRFLISGGPRPRGQSLIMRRRARLAARWPRRPAPAFRRSRSAPKPPCARRLRMTRCFRVGMQAGRAQPPTRWANPHRIPAIRRIAARDSETGLRGQPARASGAAKPAKTN